MLLKIRKDMKTAMQQKDTNRLSVLRSLMAQTLNASKTSNPINTDMQMLALLRKSSAAAKAASEEFKGAGRQDLAEKEEEQVKIMEEYAGGVEVMGEEEVRKAVEEVVASVKTSGGKLSMGEVLKVVFAPDNLGGKAVDKGMVSNVVKQVLAELPDV